DRLPVWQACSRFYIDNELSDNDLDHIANVCAQSKYTCKELDKIMFSEVWPAFAANLFSMAGNWTGWDDEYVAERVLEKSRFNLYLSWKLNPIKRFYCSEWTRVMSKVNEYRA
ncbi:MAG: hypothetical protein ABW092_10885, partial [Candidatus Thiodiazotropha sp.]